jgi:hypothetical protein
LESLSRKGLRRRSLVGRMTRRVKGIIAAEEQAAD